MSNPDEGDPERKRLRDEVRQLRTQLKGVQAQRAASEKKHQAYVERLQAANEELHFASESLDTHREELQSLNEELVSANHSLQGKIDELGHANGDLRHLMAATAIATIFLDRELRVTRYTPAATQVFRLLESDVGRPLTDLRHDLDYAGLESDAAAVFAHLVPIEREVSAAHGEWFLVRLLPYRTVDERIVGVVLTCLNITERKQAEALRLAKEAAERTNEARKEFLSRMSHELRTPLNAILGFGQILELEARTEQDKVAPGFIVKAGRHLLSLVDEVLDLSQAEGGKLRLTMGVVDLRQLILECMQLVAKLAEAQQVVCEVREPDQPLHWLWTDAQRLRQVLLNLLTNAIKYNRPGGRVVLGFRQDTAGFCLVSVRDTGLGIASADLPRLFTPFERLHAGHSEIEGTGLGLAITRSLVETLGGSIGVESKLGQGSRFWIKLPVGQVPARPAEAISPGSLVFPEAPAKQNVAVLCIEDNASNAQLVQMLVERQQPRWQFSLACDACTGLQEARRHAPDLILLDYQLPDRPGDWVLAELRRDPCTAHIPVLVLTADATAATRERFLAGGATGLLSKPFGINELMRSVHGALHLTS